MNWKSTPSEDRSRMSALGLSAKMLAFWDDLEEFRPVVVFADMLKGCVRRFETTSVDGKNLFSHRLCCIRLIIDIDDAQIYAAGTLRIGASW